MLASALQVKYGTKITNVRSAVIELKSGFSGGSSLTFLNLFETFSARELVEAYKPFALSPIGRPPKGIAQPTIVYDKLLGGWLGPWLMGATNSAIVGRTYGLSGGKWGDKFSYREYLTWGGWLYCRAAQIGMTCLGVLLMLSPFRWLATKLAPNSGEGPDEETMKNGKFLMKIVADTENGHTGSITISADSDPGYFLTGIRSFDFADLAMMVVESGLTLAYDVEKTEISKYLKNQTVLLTPSLMGETLKERLEKGGLHFNLDV